MAIAAIIAGMTAIAISTAMAYWLIGVLWRYIGVHGELIPRWAFETLWKVIG